VVKVAEILGDILLKTAGNSKSGYDYKARGFLSGIYRDW
jgi:hypothetical protein